MQHANHNETIVLWPEGAPGTASWSQEEQEIHAPAPYLYKLVRNVTEPSLTVFLPDPQIATGTGVIVCPGGGLEVLAVEHEGTEVAQWLTARGIAAFMLKYRVIETPPREEDRLHQDRDPNRVERLKRLRREHGPIALADGQQAVKIVRERATEWGLSSDRIGMMGFSAGGFVSAAVALANEAESRLDFVAPIYGALWQDLIIPADAPPFFTVVANNDAIAAEPCVRLYSAWHAAGRSAEIHIYAQGGHGFGIRKQGLPCDSWIDRFGEWMQSQGF